MIRADIGLTDSQCKTIKQVADAAIAELGISATGSLRNRLQAVADELHISTGWSRAAESPQTGDSMRSCLSDVPAEVWLKPWAHFSLDCPRARNVVCKLVTEHGADRVRLALEKTWRHMEERRLQMSQRGQTCTLSSCMLEFVQKLKESVSSSLQPCATGSASALCNCGSVERIWGRKPSDSECAIVKQLVEQMDFDPVAAAIAVRETGGSGLQPAVEWLLQNLDSLTSLSAALLESTASDELTPGHTPAPAPEPAIAAEDARQERLEQLTPTTAPVQLDAVEKEIKQMLHALGFDEHIVATVTNSFPDMTAIMRQVGFEDIKRSAVGMALAVQLSEEASNAGERSKLLSPREVLGSLISGSAEDDVQSSDSAD
jgi:hypothetical protein